MGFIELIFVLEAETESLCQVLGDVKSKIQLLKIFQGPYIELFAKFEFYGVRLSLFSTKSL